MNQELSDLQAGFRNSRETRDQIASILWITEKARELKKKKIYIYTSASLTMLKPLTVDDNKLWIFLKETGIPDHLTCLEICMQYKKQQLEMDMEQWTSSKLGKEYINVPYCYHAYLTYMQSTSWIMPGCMHHNLESRLPGEISTTSDMQMIPL